MRCTTSMQHCCNIEATHKTSRISSASNVVMLHGENIWFSLCILFSYFVSVFKFSVNFPKLLHKNCYSKIFVQIRVTKFHWIIFSVTNIVIAKKLNVVFLCENILNIKILSFAQDIKEGVHHAGEKYLSICRFFLFFFVIYVYNKYLCINTYYIDIYIYLKDKKKYRKKEKKEKNDKDNPRVHWWEKSCEVENLKSLI